MILYPTETVYGLGVNPLEEKAVSALFGLKGRDERKVSSWLVRDVEDIAHFAELSDTAVKIAEQFLPGPLTLVLPAKDNVPASLASDAGVSFRISSDPLAQALIARHYDEYNAPLTCTSANVSGLNPESTPEGIIEQFKKHRPNFSGFAEVIDGGKRRGLSSTVVGVDGRDVTIFRVGVVPIEPLLSFGV